MLAGRGLEVEHRVLADLSYRYHRDARAGNNRRLFTFAASTQLFTVQNRLLAICGFLKNERGQLMCVSQSRLLINSGQKAKLKRKKVGDET